MICVFHRLCSISWQNDYQWETRTKVVFVCFQLQPKHMYDNETENYEMFHAYL